MEGLCELVRLGDIEQIYDVKQALEARGVVAEVWGNWTGSWHDLGSHKLRLMVRRQDVVYARWIAYAAGVDVWPDGPDEGSDGAEREARARLSLRRAW
jgi:hypothetical protein